MKGAPPRLTGVLSRLQICQIRHFFLQAIQGATATAEACRDRHSAAAAATATLSPTPAAPERLRRPPAATAARVVDLGDHNQGVWEDRQDGLDHLHGGGHATATAADGAAPTAAAAAVAP